MNPENLELLRRNRDAIFRDAASFQESRGGVVQLSYWSYSLYKECPQKYAILSLGPKTIKESRDAFYAISGSIVHSLWEDFITALKQGSLDWPDAQVFLTDSVPTYYDHFVGQNTIAWPAHNEDPAGHRKVHIPLIRDSIAYVWDTFQKEGLCPRDPDTIHSEITFKEPLWTLDNPRRVVPGIILTGRVDVVFENPKDLEVVDFKDVASRSNVNWRQLIHYTFGLESKFRKPVTKAAFLLTKLKSWSSRNPYGRTYRKDYFVDLLETALKIKREPWKAVTSRHHCPRCDVSGICPEWQAQAGRQNELLTIVQKLPEGQTSF